MITTIKLNFQFFAKERLVDKGKSPARGGEDISEERQALQSANELIQKANQKLLFASVSSYASQKMSSNGAKAALQMIDFSSCLDEEHILCEDLVKQEVDKFLDEYTEFKKTDFAAQRMPSFAAKTTKNPMQILTKRDIEKMSPLELANRWGEVELYLKGN